MKKNFIASGILLIIIAVIMIAGFRHTRKNVHDLPFIKERGRLFVLSDGSDFGFVTTKDSVYGFQYEIIKAFADTMGLELVVTQDDDMEDCIAKIKSGEYDVLANLVPITTLWGKKVSFTAPLMAARQVLIQRIPKDSTSLKLKTKQEELADDTIYISKNSPYKMIINNLSDQLAAPVYITELNENKEELVKMVSEGKIKQTICNEEFAQRLQYDYPNIDYSLPVGFTQQQAWVVDNRSKLLLKELDDFLDDFIGSEAYWKIYNKYY